MELNDQYIDEAFTFDGEDIDKEFKDNVKRTFYLYQNDGTNSLLS